MVIGSIIFIKPTFPKDLRCQLNARLLVWRPVLVLSVPADIVKQCRRIDLDLRNPPLFLEIQNLSDPRHIQEMLHIVAAENSVPLSLFVSLKAGNK